MDGAFVSGGDGTTVTYALLSGFQTADPIWTTEAPFDAAKPRKDEVSIVEGLMLRDLTS